MENLEPRNELNLNNVLRTHSQLQDNFKLHSFLTFMFSSCVSFRLVASFMNLLQIAHQVVHATRSVTFPKNLQ